MKTIRVRWNNLHGYSGMISFILFGMQNIRMFCKLEPSFSELTFSLTLYFVMFASKYHRISSQSRHHQITFYNSCAWAFNAGIQIVALMIVELQNGTIAKAMQLFGNVVFIYGYSRFYWYQYKRAFRHLSQNRFRISWFIGVLMLQLAHFQDLMLAICSFKELSYANNLIRQHADQKLVFMNMYLFELFMTSFALFMIVLHDKGILTANKNAFVTMAFTVVVPTICLLTAHSGMDYHSVTSDSIFSYIRFK